ncbi:Restriction-modification system control element Bcll [Tepidibacter aestuarii]|nr:Restriction-modification system control element Bcll [Tepidibacter aestuarii]
MKRVRTIETLAPIRNNMQKYRIYKGLNQNQLAKELGVTRAYISKLERQHFIPGTKLMKKICEFFEVSLGDMFYLE